ncbi:MAG: twin-arginine translocase subunit TatC [Puniceicoccales bacterium]|jgi:sec-independent protein translocase protein TatC|nr:twin-arginine translocase subunit TatC [Puniceicoccales bacterium]
MNQVFRILVTGLGRVFRSRATVGKDEREMGFFDHLEELRGMLLRCIGAFVISMFLAFWHFREIFEWMRRPLRGVLDRQQGAGSPPLSATPVPAATPVEAAGGGAPDPVEFIAALANALLRGELPVAAAAATAAAPIPGAEPAAAAALAKVASGDSMVAMKFMDVFNVIINIGFVGGIALSSPFILFFASRFVAPALTPGEKRCIVPFCVASMALFIGGCLFSFFWLIPTSIEMMFYFVHLIGLSMTWLASDYYGFVTMVTLLIGCTFQFPLVIILLQYLEIVQTRTLFRLWRHVLVGILITCVIISPLNDPVSLGALSGVLFLFYIGAASIGSLMVRSKHRKRIREEIEYERTYARPAHTPPDDATSTDLAEENTGDSDSMDTYDDYGSSYDDTDDTSDGDEDPDQTRLIAEHHPDAESTSGNDAPADAPAPTNATETSPLSPENKSPGGDLNLVE